MKKTILITAFHIFVIKNILNTDAFKLLVSKENLRIILLVSNPKKGIFKDLYEGGNVEVRGVDAESLTNTRVSWLFSTWSHMMKDSSYLRYKRRERLDARKTPKAYVKYAAEMLISLIASKSRLIHWLYRSLFRRYAVFKMIQEIFDQYQPDLIFSIDIFDAVDVLFEIEAKRRGVKLVGMVRSWDNCHSKGLLRVIPDKILVNNDGIRNELVALHDVNPDHILKSVGLPQFDIFKQKTFTPWNEFCRKVGLDPNKRVVLFSPAGWPLSDVDGQIMDTLKKEMDEGRLPEDIQFLVRSHPARRPVLGNFQPDKRFIFDNPGVGEGKNSVMLMPDDVQHLFDSLVYSKVVVWTATTLGIDAVFFDKPQVVINFDGRETRPYSRSVRRYHDEDQMKRMLKLGGMKVTNSPKELIDAINRYLENPDLDHDKRKKVVEQQIQFTDGKSGERVAQAILGELGF